MVPGVDVARAAAESAARQSYGRLVAYLAARNRDIAGAEDALADAFAAALQSWPKSGVPANPEAWLLAVARRREVDAIRRRQTAVKARDHITLIADEVAAGIDTGELPDERLRLMFACAHPAIDPIVRAPLILQTVLGFDAVAIGSSFLVSPAAMGERLDAVLSAIYAAFSEGWTDAVGTEGRRRNLATEAIWLGRLIASLMPEKPETSGLLALMFFAEARRPARRDANGAYVPLGDQDTNLWSGPLIDEAEALLRRASSFGETGRYQLEAAVQSVHCARRHGVGTDWPSIRAIYDVLARISASPVVAINRAVAIAEIEGPAAGYAALKQLADDTRLVSYQPYWAASAEMLARLGRKQEAAEAYDRATGLETDETVRAFLSARKARLAN